MLIPQPCCLAAAPLRPEDPKATIGYCHWCPYRPQKTAEDLQRMNT